MRDSRSMCVERSKPSGRGARDQAARPREPNEQGAAPEKSRSRRWPEWLGLAALVTLPVLSLLTVILWLQGESSEDDDAVPADAGMSHVHGLGTNPRDGATYVATHSGVFRLAEGSDPVRVADRYQDTMGFTVAGPDRFLASGHPDLTDQSLPTHLGLIESTDAAETWKELSLGGEADLHALDVGPSGIVAFDALSGRLMSSGNGRDWEVLAEGGVVDVAAHPGNARTVMVTTPDGALVSYDAQGEGEVLTDAPLVGFVDWPRENMLVAAGADGQLHRSEDGGESWKPVSDPVGKPQAIDVSEGAWLVATHQAVLRSADDGHTWEKLVEFAS